jgi:hypothetical protein
VHVVPPDTSDDLTWSFLWGESLACPSKTLALLHRQIKESIQPDEKLISITDAMSLAQLSFSIDLWADHHLPLL